MPVMKPSGAIGATGIIAKRRNWPTYATGSGLIEAAANLYRSSDPASHRERVLAYEAAMAKLAANYPRIEELNIFWALAVTQTALPEDKTYKALLRAAAILEPLFVKYPERPGLAHYIIHAFDVPPLASKALPAARRYTARARCTACLAYAFAHFLPRWILAGIHSQQQPIGRSVQGQQRGRRRTACAGLSGLCIPANGER